MPTNAMTHSNLSDHPLLRVTELRAVEASAQSNLAPGTLMQRAGAAAAELALQIGNQRPGPVWVLAGPGNNGGDAIVVARLLAGQGLPVVLALLDDPARYHGEARHAWLAWYGSVQRDLTGLDQAAMIIDGLFGIGLNRAMPATAAGWVEQINRVAALGCPVIALDVPSGLEADTGHLSGATAIRASHTITFIADKPGLHTLDGPDHAGRITVANLQLNIGPTPGRLNQPGCFAASMQPRRRNSHKGLFGHLGIAGGNNGMVGAALLAARTGLQAGSGRVSVQLLGRDAPAFDALQPELMLRIQLADLALSAVSAGPGMGQDANAVEVLTALLQRPIGLVLDADALNIIAAEVRLSHLVRERSAATILTPHPLEAARLLGRDLASVQRDRVQAALELAYSFNACVVLKGAGSVIAAANGDWSINPTGNPALASGGTGDVLAGLIGSLLAQGWPSWQAACGGVWLHGTAADELVRSGIGPIGVTAGELIGPIRKLLNQLADGNGSPCT